MKKTFHLSTFHHQNASLHYHLLTKQIPEDMQPSFAHDGDTIKGRILSYADALTLLRFPTVYLCSTCCNQVTMSTQKRQFPYYSNVPEVELKRQALGSVNPGLEPNEPCTFEAPTPTEEPTEVMEPPDQRAVHAVCICDVH